MRAHVGGGRPGVSTGAGPFTLYQATGGGSRRASTTAPTTPAEGHEAARQALARVDQLHHGTFPPATRQIAPTVPLPKFGKLVATSEKETLRGISRLDRAARKAAKLRAHAQAETWARDLMVLAEGERLGQQAALDASWSALIGNDPGTVMRVIHDSLTTAGAPARVTYVRDGVAGLIVTGPPPEELPTERPALTRAGAPTVAAMNKTEFATVTNKVIAARIILVVRQCFGVAPGLKGISVVLVDPAGGQSRLAVSFERQRFESASGGVEPSSSLQACASEIVSKPSGRTGELRVIKLDGDSIYARVMGVRRS